MSGHVVFGDQYFSRKRDEKKVWRYVDRGSHLMLLAPRRSGKTTLLRNLEKEPKEGYLFLYAMVQSCETEHEFYKQVLGKLQGSDFQDNLTKLKTGASSAVEKALSSVKNFKFSGVSITLTDNTKHITYQDFITVLAALDLEEKLIIVIDEYPDVVERISKNESDDAARSFLASGRSLCQEPSITNKVQFIFTGSIGLDTLANRLNASNLVNDRDKVSLSTLNIDEAKQFLEFLFKTRKAEWSLNESSVKYLIKKVEWLMPYYIELLWERLEDYCSDNDITQPSENDIDHAYQQMFDQTYRSAFNHWAERLKRFKKKEQKFAKAVLDRTTLNDELSINELLNISQAPEFESVAHNYIFDCLEHDGYLFEASPKTYKFTSPILRDWWSRYANRTL